MNLPTSPPSSSPPTPLRKDRFLRWMVISVIMATLLLGVFGAWRVALRARTDRLLNQIHAEGYPTTGKELNEYYVTPPPDQNAAELYERAMTMIVNDSVFEKNHPPYGDSSLFHEPLPWEPWPADWVRDYPVYFEKSRGAFELLEKADLIHQSRYSGDFMNPGNAFFSHLGGLRRLANHLRYRAQLAAEVDDTQTATRLMLQSLSVHESLRDEPLVISQLVRTSISTLNIAGFECILNRVKLDESQLAGIARRLEPIQPDANLDRVYAGDLVYSLEAYRRRENLLSLFSSHSPLPDSVMLFLYQTTGMLDIDRYRTIGLIHEMMAQAKLDCIKRRTAMHDTMKHLPKPPMMYPMCNEFVSYREPTLRTFDCSTAYLACLKTAIAIERFRLSHDDKLPDRVEDLVPQYLPSAPIDPFNGLTVGLIKSHGGYTVYSIGPKGAGAGVSQYDIPKGTYIPYDQTLSVTIRRPAKPQ